MIVDAWCCLVGIYIHYYCRPVNLVIEENHLYGIPKIQVYLLLVCRGVPQVHPLVSRFGMICCLGWLVNRCVCMRRCAINQKCGIEKIRLCRSVSAQPGVWSISTVYY